MIFKNTSPQKPGSLEFKLSTIVKMQVIFWQELRESKAFMGDIKAKGRCFCIVVDSSVYSILECGWGKERDSILTNVKLQLDQQKKKKRKINNRATDDFVTSGVGTSGVIFVTYLENQGGGDSRINHHPSSSIYVCRLIPGEM